jgi:transcriptional regulator with XRE-family HTH domain
MTERATTRRQLFADRIKQAQAEAGLTNGELASELDIAIRLLQVWRSGKGAPSAHNLYALAKALDRDVAWFFETETKEAA